MKSGEEGKKAGKVEKKLDKKKIGGQGRRTKESFAEYWNDEKKKKKSAAEARQVSEPTSDSNLQGNFVYTSSPKSGTYYWDISIRGTIAVVDLLGYW